MGLNEINGVGPTYVKRGPIDFGDDGNQNQQKPPVTVPIGQPTQKGIGDAANQTNFGIPGLSVDYSARYQKIADDAKATLDKVTANSNDEAEGTPVHLNYEGDDVLLKEQRRTKENFKDLQAQYEKDINQYGAIVDDEGTVKYVLTKKERKELNKFLKDNGVKKKKRNEILSDVFLTEKEAKKAAKQMAKNEQRKEEFEGTRTYADKAEYKQAEKARKAERKALVEQYRTQKGMSRREAKEAADNALVKNIYASKATRKNEEFRDEQGNFSNMKLKEGALRRANMGNQGDATKDYRFSLGERRAVAQLEGTTTHRQKHYTEDAGISTEYNHTSLIRAGAAGVAIGTGIAIGAATGGVTVASESASTAAAGAVAGDAVAGAAAGATADAAATAAVTVSGELIGGAAGTVTGLAAAPFLSDHGEKIKHNYAINKPQPVVQEPEKPPVVEQPEKPPVVEEPEKPPVVEQPCPDKFRSSAGCPITIEKGSNWLAETYAHVKIDGVDLSIVRDEKKNDPNYAKAVKYSNAYATAWHLYEYQDKLDQVDFHKPQFFKVGANVTIPSNLDEVLNNEDLLKKYPSIAILKGKKITLDCDAQMIPGKIARGRAQDVISGNGIGPRQEVQRCGEEDWQLVPRK